MADKKIWYYNFVLQRRLRMKNANDAIIQLRFDAYTNSGRLLFLNVNGLQGLQRVLSSIRSFVAAPHVKTCEKHPVLATVAHCVRSSAISLQAELDILQTNLRSSCTPTQLICQKSANHFKILNDRSDMKQKPIHPALVLCPSYFPENVDEIKMAYPSEIKGQQDRTQPANGR